MPRFAAVPRDEADFRVIPIYDLVFGPERDPAVSPGTATGSPGNFFTTWAHAPAVLAHYHTLMPKPGAAPEASQVDPAWRALAACRTGYALQSKFVFSQNCKACRLAGHPMLDAQQGVFRRRTRGAGLRRRECP
jgi:hypothetical protein